MGLFMTRILHVLDHSLPLHSGYTFRTRAILKAQQAAGLEVRAITSQRHNLEAEWETAVEEVDGLPVAFPADGYQGDYIVDIAEGLIGHYGVSSNTLGGPPDASDSVHIR